MSKSKQRVVIGLVLLSLYLVYKMLGIIIPINNTRSNIGTKKVYYKNEITLFVMCDSINEIDAYETDDYIYQYELIHIRKGCMSNLYIWDGFRPITLKKAIDTEIIGVDEFIESDLARKSVK